MFNKGSGINNCVIRMWIVALFYYYEFAVSHDGLKWSQRPVTSNSCINIQNTSRVFIYIYIYINSNFETCKELIVK